MLKCRPVMLELCTDECLHTLELHMAVGIAHADYAEKSENPPLPKNAVVII